MPTPGSERGARAGAETSVHNIARLIVAEQQAGRRQVAGARQGPAAAPTAVSLAGVTAALSLLDGGATVPFIARYRKEATSGIDEVVLRDLAERAKYLRELLGRRQAILDAVAELGALTPEFERAALACTSKTELEDLYAPFKPKRRTRGSVAVERGLLPLAESLWQCATGHAQASGDPVAVARAFIDASREVPDADAALAGARDICAERIADLPSARKRVRAALERGQISVKKAAKLRRTPTKFDNYDGCSEPSAQCPSHRLLAMLRGEAEGVLKLALGYDEQRTQLELERDLELRCDRAGWAAQLREALGDSLKRLLLPAARNEVRGVLRERAERDAITVFAKNLEQLLLAPAYGDAWVLGIDPGQRTGCKCVVVDPTGKLVASALINLVQGADAQRQAAQVLSRLLDAHPIRAVAVGNGTHGRETEDFVRALVKPRQDPPEVVSVNESGASVYSASDVAREELPEQDVTVRGAVSIARRLQDPLAELVKIDPQSIGVGQYQHDVSQALLSQKLAQVVESCVNRVGVELNTASPSLLSYVSGIGPKLARKIVKHREQHGAFASRAALVEVPGLGAKTFEQAAGFIRVRGSAHPLDESAVHPERYALVERIAKDAGLPLRGLVGNSAALPAIDSSRYLSSDVGHYTLTDLLSELAKPGRDPRAKFSAPKFRDDVRELSDVRVGMLLEGRVTNVTAFGAFVDIGVHQDGLVHVSALSDRFVKDPSEVVRVGDRLRVKVLSVDVERKRISLSAREAS